MSEYIPDHLLTNIFLHLPVDSLLRFRCVSKSWRALIDSPNFTKMHFTKSHQEKNCPDNIQIVALKLDKLCTFNFDLVASSATNAKQINYPVEFICNLRVHLVGSCNGLLCLMNPNNNIVLWNPWIQKYWEFSTPQTDASIRADNVSFLGFGYDQVHDDYKVLNLATALTDFLSGEASNLYQDDIYLYSLKLNSWRRIENLPFRVSLGSFGDGALLNGALHWIAEKNEQNGNKYCVLAFDLSSEEFRKMACPSFPEEYFYSHNLKIINGSLCLIITNNYPWNGISVVDLWVMEDYGVDESWTKLTSVKMPSDFWNLGHFTPLAYSKKSKQVLLQINWEKLVIYDLETKTKRDVNINGAVVSCLASSVCIGSLFWPL